MQTSTVKTSEVPLIIAYYCSGHGYGHATRVSAFTRLLLTCQEPESNTETIKPVIHIVSSAPRHVFSDSIEIGAQYRFAEIDPVIVQPVAYHVDRVKSIEVLKRFLERKEQLLEEERCWLVAIQARCVLSDAAFLGCLAAKAAAIPSAVITNFTFDAVYSYLSTSIYDPRGSCAKTHRPALLSSNSVPPADIKPLVEQIFEGYSYADLLVRLPGYIPIPSFISDPSLPSSDWVDTRTGRFTPEVAASVSASTRGPSTLKAPARYSDTQARRQRTIIQAPLIVRHPSPGIFTPTGRSRLLSAIGIPMHRHDPQVTKILIVSFGGQVFKKPRSPASTPPRMSRRSSTSTLSDATPSSLTSSRAPSPLSIGTKSSTSSTSATSDENVPLTPERLPLAPPRLVTPGHIYVPGAPPSFKPPFAQVDDPFLSCQKLQDTPVFEIKDAYSNFPLSDEQLHAEAKETDAIVSSKQVVEAPLSLMPQLLPDDSWIAIICGVTKEQYASCDGDQEDGLPDDFYVAPKDVYMPDLTVLGDVLLGKLGYGTVSECVDACTPFVYVSRPLFIEEHGLRLLLDQEGSGVELSREDYEAGHWADAVSQAYSRGKEAKTRKLASENDRIYKDASAGDDSKCSTRPREEEGRRLARQVLHWVEDWHSDQVSL